MDKFLPPVDACPVCDSHAISKGLEVRYWRENPVSFFDCASCGLTFANPMPSDQLIEDGNSALVRYYHQGKDFNQEFREARQSYLKGKLLGKKLAQWKAKGRFLELGAFQGFFSLGVRENCEWQVETLEIAPALVDFIQNKLHITVHAGTLENCALPENTYDFVVCHDLIEHINQPRPFLRKLHSILAPGGRLQILTPNTLQDFAFNRRAYASGQPPTILLNHIMNFSPKSLRLALEKEGFALRKFYCFDVQHAMKDFGLFGLGKPGKLPAGPSLKENLALPVGSLMHHWTQEKIKSLRTHPKTSNSYAFFKEILPNAFRLRMPPQLGIGHEMYALAEKH